MFLFCERAHVAGALALPFLQDHSKIHTGLKHSPTRLHHDQTVSAFHHED
jgi:hypothetical protein